jgi:SAM-dependent methyltransferase
MHAQREALQEPVRTPSSEGDVSLAQRSADGGDRAVAGSRVHDYFESGAYLKPNPLTAIRARLVADLLCDLEKKSVLDLGCGDGSLSRALRGNDLTLVDFSDAMLERARRNVPEARHVPADVLAWEPDRLYDAVLAVGLLAHVESVERLLEKVAAALRPDGRCVLQVTDAGHPLGWLLARYGRIRPGEGYHANELSRRELIEQAAAYGLKPVATRRYGLLLPGTGRLPYRWRAWIEDRFASGWSARAAAQVLVMFVKTSVEERHQERVGQSR